MPMSEPKKNKIGVIYILHGGFTRYSPQHIWDSAVQMFSYDPNHPVHDMVIWNADFWPMIGQSEFSVKFCRKYEFEYARIGGNDPFPAQSEQQCRQLQAALDQNSPGIEFEVDYACWMCGDKVDHYPWPRFIYLPPPGKTDKVTYCGEQEPDGPWPGCDPQRYNVDGPVERLLKKGVSRILAIDMAVGGVRFYKSFDVVRMTRRLLEKWNREHNAAIALTWLNDPDDFMEKAYPQDEGWTPVLGPPEKPVRLDIAASPNPLIQDPELAMLHVEGLEKSFSKSVPDAETGILIFNHGLFDANRRFFDPKIDDTTELNRIIKRFLLERHPDMLAENIIGAYGGVKEVNPENQILERTRRMRGEDLAHSYPYASEKELPDDEWGYRYWDGLEYLKNRGVKHIVVGFSQVVTDSVLTLVEMPNQIAKEIGVKTWARYGRGDFETYPGVGHPFAKYWGNWVDTDGLGSKYSLKMGGESGLPYPPPRQSPLDEKREDMDPSLVFDLCDYGHLGYDPTKGSPDPQKPVQDQYTGTWDFYVTPGNDARLATLLARHVMDAAKKLL